jgi:hypothetical protein
MLLFLFSTLAISRILAYLIAKAQQTDHKVQEAIQFIASDSLREIFSVFVFETLYRPLQKETGDRYGQ